MAAENIVMVVSWFNEENVQNFAEKLAVLILGKSMPGIQIRRTNCQKDIDLRFYDSEGSNIGIGEVSLDADENAEKFKGRLKKTGSVVQDSRLKSTWSFLLENTFSSFRKQDLLVELVLEMIQHEVLDSDWALGSWGGEFKSRLKSLGISTIRASNIVDSPGQIFLFPPIDAGVINFSNEDFDNWIGSKLESEQYGAKVNQLLGDSNEEKHLVIVMGSKTPWQLIASLSFRKTNLSPTPRKKPALDPSIKGLWILGSSGMDWFYWSRSSNTWNIYRVNSLTSNTMINYPIYIINC